jgi:hypothetical protein
MTWSKALLGLALLALLVWGVVWGRRQEGALARARADIVLAREQATRDSLAVERSRALADSALEVEGRTRAEARRLSESILGASREAERLRVEDSVLRLKIPPDSEAGALPFWKATASRLDSQVVALRGEVGSLRGAWRLDSLVWLARIRADSSRLEAELSLSETRRKLAQAALAAAGGDACRIALIGRCPSRTAVALISIIGTAAALKL